MQEPVLNSEQGYFEVSNDCEAPPSNKSKKMTSWIIFNIAKVAIENYIIFKITY